jgi:hypothetical protein
MGTAAAANANASAAVTTANNAAAAVATAQTTADGAAALGAVNSTAITNLQGTVATQATAITAATSTANTALTTANGAAADVETLKTSAVVYGSGKTIELRANNGAGTVISNVADGTAAGDAVNMGQLTNAQIAIIKAVQTLVQSGACQYSGGSLSCGGATAAGSNSTAMGTNALSAGENSTAVGTNARSVGANSVAIGAGSLAIRANTVSVGNEQTGMTRAITGVSAGVYDNDAVNVAQFRAGLSETLTKANRYAAQAAARAMSIPTAQISAGKYNAFAVALGNYDGYGALGATYAHKLDDEATLQLGVATGGSGFAGRASVNVSW